GRGIRMVGGMTDLGVLRAAQHQIRRQAALIEEARDAILVFGLDGRVTFWNRAAGDIYGVPASRALGRPAVELVSSDAVAFGEASAAVLASGTWQGQLSF